MEQRTGRSHEKPRGPDLDADGSSVHSFIVKLWVERAADEATRATWRGNITHVPDGRRRPVRKLDDITDFIEPYLRGANVGVGRGRQLMRWLRRWGRHKTGGDSSG